MCAPPSRSLGLGVSGPSTYLFPDGYFGAIAARSGPVRHLGTSQLLKPQVTAGSTQALHGVAARPRCTAPSSATAIASREEWQQTSDAIPSRIDGETHWQPTTSPSRTGRWDHDASPRANGHRGSHGRPREAHTEGVVVNICSPHTLAEDAPHNGLSLGCGSPAVPAPNVLPAHVPPLRRQSAAGDGFSDELQHVSIVVEENCGHGSPRTMLRSARVETSDQGLSLYARLPPSELVTWRDIQIVRPISLGSFGEVFLANYKDRQVAVKRCLLSQHGRMTAEQLRNLEREINAYRTLDHPSILGYLGCTLESPNLAVVVEYAPHGSVFDLLYTHRVNLQAAIRLKIASQVSLAVCYMHSCDPVIVHRDLKTQNLVLGSDYSAKLCDFGKAQALEDEAALSQLDNGGSPRYMAPECFLVGGHVTEKVDVWGLGCCLVEVFGGPLPYEDIPQMAEVVSLLLRGRKPPLVPPWFTSEIKPVLARCFDFEPQHRPSISEIQLDLKRMVPEEMERCGMDKRRTH